MYLAHTPRSVEPEAPKHAATDFERPCAVFQNPEEDTPRLVFADFLEENDQPDRARSSAPVREHGCQRSPRGRRNSKRRRSGW